MKVKLLAATGPDLAGFFPRQNVSLTVYSQPSWVMGECRAPELATDREARSDECCGFGARGARGRSLALRQGPVALTSLFKQSD
jgi:hypothetical protein